uniref:ORF15 n=1 Tax=Kallithea virus TaxID=1654582 RepID=A0A0F7KMZ0_9VIRU|nr:ORF15 [Kallithea virus]
MMSYNKVESTIATFPQSADLVISTDVPTLNMNLRSHSSLKNITLSQKRRSSGSLVVETQREPDTFDEDIDLLLCYESMPDESDLIVDDSEQLLNDSNIGIDDQNIKIPRMSTTPQYNDVKINSRRPVDTYEHESTDYNGPNEEQSRIFKPKIPSWSNVVKPLPSLSETFMPLLKILISANITSVHQLIRFSVFSIFVLICALYLFPKQLVMIMLVMLMLALLLIQYTMLVFKRQNNNKHMMPSSNKPIDPKKIANLRNRLMKRSANINRKPSKI